MTSKLSVDRQLNEFTHKLQREANNSKRHQLFDLTFNFGIHENEGIDFVVKIAKFGSYFITGFAVIWVLIGILALFLDRLYLSYFAMICVLHLLVGPLSYVAFEEGKRLMFMILTLVNHIWLGLASIYFITYLFIENNESFQKDVIHHVLFFIYWVTSIGVHVSFAMLCFKLISFYEQKIKQLNDTNT